MLFVILVSIMLIAVAARVASVGKGQIVSERPKAKIDPFADHPMHCKCPAHR